MSRIHVVQVNHILYRPVVDWWYRWDKRDDLGNRQSFEIFKLMRGRRIRWTNIFSIISVNILRLEIWGIYWSYSETFEKPRSVWGRNLLCSAKHYVHIWEDRYLQESILLLQTNNARLAKLGSRSLIIYEHRKSYKTYKGTKNTIELKLFSFTENIVQHLTELQFTQKKRGIFSDAQIT